jgi:hypothetical protein
MPISKRFKLKPNSNEIENLCNKIGDLMQSLYFKTDVIQSQKMIIHELIKSGTRVGNMKPREDEITVFLNISAYTITIEVKSPVDDTCSENLRKLDRTIQFIRGYQDPFEAYLLLENKSNDLGYLNGLNLARIAYEGQAILDFYVSDENVLNQSAIRMIATKSD